jgi:hypothetical protein
VLTDPSLPITNVEARIHSFNAGYARTFEAFGRAASFGLLVPGFSGSVEGEVFEEAREVTRRGLGDSRLRLATNIIGGEALTKEEFAATRPSTVLGTSLVIIAPTGEYDSERLINLGLNRWAFKPEIGGSMLLGDFFVDASAGVWFFTDNSQFFGDTERSQDPLATLQLHAGYTFRPGLWLAGDATYYRGGQTSVDGDEKDDTQANSRYGMTLSIPLSEGIALKLAGSKGLTTRVGGEFTTVGAALQYRWFDD